jgi:glyoxylase-like metal-dependent hydrolase (beta-lactamase superfamily II)
MNHLRGLCTPIVAAVILILSAISFSGQQSIAQNVQFYAMDCGRFDSMDLSAFSDTGEYDHQTGSLADPCFLIHHPKGWLLWDTGLADSYVGHPVQASNGTVLSRSQSLVSELEMLNLTPADITYVGFSHFHSDHTGNANLFVSSTWLIQRKEFEFANSTPTPVGVDPKTFSDYQKAKIHLLDGDFDVFGDGTVRILFAPGHTPGHQILLVKLRQKGYIILAGDLYQRKQSEKDRLVPDYNTSRAETLASMDRVERLARNLNATVIAQHSMEDFATLPKYPEAWQ